MKRTTKVRVKFDSGNYAESVVTTFNKGGLTRDEATHQHDEAVDKVVMALRSLPYVADAPLRSVSIR
jgi:hypothetical protein